jgi:hypothetical protein
LEQTHACRITVRFQVAGFHRWPDAPEHRAYLRNAYHLATKLSDRHNGAPYTVTVYEDGEAGATIELGFDGSQAERNAPGPVPGSALLDRSGHQPIDKLSRNRRE